MIAALSLGLLAALAWGVHDVCIRFVSERTGIFASLLTVQVTGFVILSGLSLFLADFADLSGPALRYALASGVFFAVAGLALFKAFSIGPVRLVAPIIGAYPVLSVGLSVVQGASVSSGQWLAIVMLIAGVGLVASSADDPNATPSNKRAAIGWSIFAAFGFFVTFALGQHATAMGAELPVLLITRVAALVAVVAIGLALRQPMRPARAQLPRLMVMGVLDATALSAVLIAGGLPFAAFAAVTSSIFGLVAVVLAWIFLRERLSLVQWAGVGCVFAAIAYLAA